jgi:hypothetical protein
MRAARPGIPRLPVVTAFVRLPFMVFSLSDSLS